MTVIPSAPVPAPAPAPALARQALDEIGRARPDARREIGDRYLRSIADEGACTESERLIASTALQCSRLHVRAGTAQNSQQISLEALASGVAGPIGQALTKMGAASMRGAQTNEDKLLVGRAFLSALADHADAPALRQFAASAATLSETAGIYGASSLRLLHEAFDELSAGLGPEPIERQLVKFAQAAMKGAHSDSDRVAIGRGALAAIEHLSSDPVVAAHIRCGREALGDGASSDLVALHAALDGIAAGRRVVDIVLKGSRLTVRVPINTPTEGPVTDAEMALLRECVPHNREVTGALAYQLRTNEAARPALEKDLADKTAAYEALSATTRMSQKHLSSLQGIQGLSSLAFAGGALVALSGTPVGAVISLLGLGSLAITIFKMRGAAATAQAQNAALERQLLARYDATDRLTHATHLANSARQLLSRAEPLVKPLDDRFRMAEVTRLAEGPKPDPNAHIDVSDDYVTIGHVRVARH